MLTRVVGRSVDVLRSDLALIVAATFSVQGLAYLSQFALARFVPPDRFGELRTAESLIAFLVTVGAAGMPTLAVKAIAHTPAGSRRAALLLTLLAVAFGAGGITSLAAWSLARAVSERSHGAVAGYVAALAWTVALGTTSRTCLNYYIGVQQFRRAAFLGVGLSSLALVVLVSSVAVAGTSGWVLGRYVTEGGYVLVVAFSVRHALARGTPPRNYLLPRLVVLGLPISLGLGARAVLDSLGLWSLAQLGVPKEEIGQYGVASLAYTAAAVVPASLCSMTLPRLAEQLHDREAFDRMHGRLLRSTALLSLLSSGALVLASPLIPYLLGRQYSGAPAIVRVLSLALVPRMVASACGATIVLFDRSVLSAIANTILIPTSAAACIFLVPRFGATGAAFAVVLVETVGVAFFATASWRLRASGPPVGAEGTTGMKIAFCVRGVTPAVVQRTEFYRQDCEILGSLGHEVKLVTKPSELRGCDVAFVWWWNHLWLWGPIARLRGIPIITTGVFDVPEYRGWPWYKRALKRWGTPYSDVNVFVSQLEVRQVPEAIAIDPATIRYSPLVIDTAVYSPAPRDGAGPFTIFNVCWQRATNIERKMIPELLEAFARFKRDEPEARLILAGPPEDGAAILKALADKLGVASSVEFPGEVSRDEKVRLMRSCTVYCQVSRFEGFGVAIAEAMACGAPVIVSRVGAVPEIVGECGVYAEPTVAGIHAALREFAARRPALAGGPEAGVVRIRECFSVERRRRDLANALSEVTSP